MFTVFGQDLLGFQSSQVARFVVRGDAKHAKHRMNFGRTVSPELSQHSLGCVCRARDMPRNIGLTDKPLVRLLLSSNQALQSTATVLT
jgi:hypothetical protein